MQTPDESHCEKSLRYTPLNFRNKLQKRDKMSQSKEFALNT